MSKAKETFDREYCWFDEYGNLYYLNAYMIFKFGSDREMPEYENKQAPSSIKIMQELADKMFKEVIDHDTVRVETLNIKQIGEHTEKTASGKTRYVKFGESAFNPDYLKTIRRLYKDAFWYIRPDKGVLSNLYVVDPDSMDVVAVLLPMRVS